MEAIFTVQKQLHEVLLQDVLLDCLSKPCVLSVPRGHAGSSSLPYLYHLILSLSCMPGYWLCACSSQGGQMSSPTVFIFVSITGMRNLSGGRPLLASTTFLYHLKVYLLLPGLKCMYFWGPFINWFTMDSSNLSRASSLEANKLLTLFLINSDVTEFFVRVGIGKNQILYPPGS